MFKFKRLIRFVRLKKDKLLIGLIGFLLLSLAYSAWSNNRLSNELDTVESNLHQTKVALTLTEQELLSTETEIKAERQARVDLYERLVTLNEEKSFIEKEYQITLERYNRRNHELAQLDLSYEELLKLNEEQRNEILQARCDQTSFDDEFIDIVTDRLQF